jgi:tetratricopeptide (TPR) repeat protein
VYIIAFHSCRGGVGRTTTLVNVGFELVRRGRNVLLVDFDLESPDLTSFPPLGRPEPHPGIVEYVAAYRERGESPDVTEYLYPVDTAGRKGRLWVMPAGRIEDRYYPPDRAYWEALAGIDWQGLYDRQDGYLFFEDTRAQWKQLGAEYVLIDAHAGITPALGISTRQLADAVVHINPRRGAGVGFDQMIVWIEEAEHTLEKRIEQFFIDSGVVEEDDWEPCEDNNFCISFSHRLLLERKVVVVSEAHGRLAKEYRRFTNALIAANFARDRDSALFLLRKFLADPKTTIERGHEGELDQIIDGFPNDAAILAQAACCLYGSGRYGRALEVLDQAVELRPDSPELLWQRASYRRRLNMTPGAISDLLKLLDVRDPQKCDRSFEPEENSLESLLDPWAAVDWRFDLPRELREGAAAFVPDYSDALLRLPGIDRYVVSAVRQLRQLSPEAYEEAKRKPAVAALSSDARAVLLAERLPDGEEDDPHTLIRERKWAEAVALLAPRLQQSDDRPLEDALCLFIAYWGLGNKEELEKCGKKAWDQSRRRGPKKVSELQMMALVCWKIGLRKEADELLDSIDEKAPARPRRRVFSYWRFAEVPRRVFEEDTALLRQQFKGANVSPPFLGKQAAS